MSSGLLHRRILPAQEQFSRAQNSFNKKEILWGIISGVFALGFIVTAVLFSKEKLPENVTYGWMIYHAAIRITVLTAIGAVATFCLKIFRAQMHMKEQNLHRQRVTNSLSSFVESASTPEQRDIILAHLIESIIAFGNSGLISEKDDAVSPAKLTIDSLTKNVTFQGKQ